MAIDFYIAIQDTISYHTLEIHMKTILTLVPALAIDTTIPVMGYKALESLIDKVYVARDMQPTFTIRYSKGSFTIPLTCLEDDSTSYNRRFLVKYFPDVCRLEEYFTITSEVSFK